MNSDTSEANENPVTNGRSGQMAGGRQVNAGREVSSVHVGDVVGGDKIAGDKISGDKISGDVVITGQVAGDVQITYVQRAPLPPPPRPLPPPTADFFVGREADLATYTQTLDQAGIAVISGMAGVGKTTLAAVLARRVARPEQIFWHAFHEGEGVEGVIWRLAGFLAANGQEAVWAMLQNAQMANSSPPPPELLFDYLVEQVCGRGYLICLDDFQNVVDNPLLNQLVEQIRPLLPAGELKLILTSRVAPDFTQLVTFEALEGLAQRDLAQMLAANDLYLEEEQIARLHSYTGGNPQMLTLAMDLLLGDYEAEALLEKLVETDDLEDFLMDEIESRLTRNERLVMSAVAVLLGYPGSRAAVEAVLDGRSLRRVLRDLSDRFLLTVSRSDGERLYNQHAIVRDFFYEGLNQRERSRMHRRAAEYYRDQAIDSLLAARHFFEGGAYSEAADLAADNVGLIINHGQARQLESLLERFQRDQIDGERWIAVRQANGRVHAYFGENAQARDHYERALAELPQAPETHPAYVRLCYAMGDLLRQQDPQEALDWFQRGCAAISEETAAQKAALNIGEGTVYTFLERYEEAKSALETGLSLLGPQPSQLRVTALENLGIVYASLLGDLDTATALTNEALAINESLGDQFKKAELLSTLGAHKHEAGDWSAAMTDFEAAERLARDLGNDKIIAMTEANLGHALMLRGAYEAAEQHIATGLRLFKQTEEHIFAVQAMLNLTEIYLQQERWAETAAMLDQVEQLARELEAKYYFPEILNKQAELALGKNDLAEAAAKTETALEIARELNSPYDTGIILQVWGRVLARLGEPLKSESAFAESIELLQEIDTLGAARGKAAWGLVLVKNGETDRGELMLAEAQATFELLGADGDLSALAKQSMK